MKILFSLLLLVPAVCVACEVRPTSSQTAQNNSAALVPTPTPTPNPIEVTAPVQDTGPCSLVRNQAPAVNGLRNGITAEQVLALIPGSTADGELRAELSRPPNQFGVSSFQMRPDKYPSKETKEKFAGVNQITFSLLDGRVSSITVGYNGPQYSHVDEFVEKFVAGTNLPAADAWQPYVGLDNQMKTLACKEFDIRIFAGGEGGNLNYVLIRDLVADKELKDRKAKAKQKSTP